MPDGKQVIWGFQRRRKPADRSLLAKLFKLPTSPGQHFVRVALMPDVEQQPVRPQPPHQLGHDLIFALELLFKLGNLLLLYRNSGVGRLAFKGRRSILEKGSLPGIEERGLNLMFLAHLRDRHVVDEMFAEDFYLLQAGELSSGLFHSSGPFVRPRLCNSNRPFFQFQEKQHNFGNEPLVIVVINLLLGRTNITTDTSRK